MSLRFVFGPSGAGKSRQLYTEIIERASKNPRQNFLIIVPDQFTMQTQKDFVSLSDREGIMNIDVLSFGRLGHRIMAEVGSENVPVLDDTGKSLVLQKVAAALKPELPALGSLLHRQGYIHEVKSAISEFMQYGVSVEDMDKLIGYAKKRGALSYKLKDLKTLYKGFVEYIDKKFITTEETLDVLRRSLSKSKILEGSVVAFDGFTGFTPIQNRLIRELMGICAETIVTVTLGEAEYPYELDGEQRLFHLSKKTVCALEKLAGDILTERQKDIFIVPSYDGKEPAVHFNDARRDENFRRKCEVRFNPEHRFKDSPALHALERSLFRYGNEPFMGEQEEILIFETTSPADEVHQTGLFINELIKNEGASYRDFAVIMGDLEGYAPYVETEFSQMKIPCFIDRNRGIVLNPMIEYIKSGIGLYLKDFSYESVFHYLRSGFSGIDREDIDLLENYCLKINVRGYKKWSRVFVKKTKDMEEDEEKLAHINQIREVFMSQVEVLNCRDIEVPEEAVSDKDNKSGKKMKSSARNYVNRLYDFLVQNEVQQKLVEFEKKFNESGELTRAGEYAQIYRLVMELLDQIHALLGEEEISLQEFFEILEAGFSEIEVGTIPQNVDRVLVGDIERTRLKQVKYLFFMGINDGNIPKGASKGGIISDTDREFLKESDIELAPTPRQQMFIQRLYLYLNMTKPAKRLYLSYSRINSQGKSLRPAYLVDVVKKMFPKICVMHPQNRRKTEQIVTCDEGVRYLANGLREYVSGSMSDEEKTDFYTIYEAYGTDISKRERLVEAAFKRYDEGGISKTVARALYGVNLENSVSRLETYASCAYRHFLQYGLSLKEREEFGFEAVDMGNVYHEVLERFAAMLLEAGYTWFDFTREFAQGAVMKALEECAAQYGETVLYANSRNEYSIKRMGRILMRTVLTLQSQLKRGSFTPDKFEVSFSRLENLDSINVALSEGEKMRLRGRIDRIDTAEDSEHVYVKVIDYKSGNKQFDIAALYYGLQLQLVVYMNAALEYEAKKHPDKEVIPAALLYYHIDDPVVESGVELSEDEINKQILSKLNTRGVVNSQYDIVEKLDSTMLEKSDVIPVEKKKDGSYTARSGVMSAEELGVVSNYVNHKIREIGRKILDGSVEINPYEKGAQNACAYCPYKKVCGFDNSIPGFDVRKLEPLDKNTALERMKTCQ